MQEQPPESVNIIEVKKRVTLPLTTASIAAAATLSFFANFRESVGYAKELLNTSKTTITSQCKNIGLHIRSDYIPNMFGAGLVASIIGLGVDNARYQKRRKEGQADNEPPVLKPLNVGIVTGAVVGMTLGDIYHDKKLLSLSDRAIEQQTKAYNAASVYYYDALHGGKTKDEIWKEAGTATYVYHKNYRDAVDKYEKEKEYRAKDISQGGIAGGLVIGSIAGAILRRRKEDQDPQAQR